MTRINDQRPLPQPGPIPRKDGSTIPKPPRWNRAKSKKSAQRKEREHRDAEYNAMADLYLIANPRCVNCPNPSRIVHHIVRGVAGRAKSLLNPNAWLEVCSDQCHDEVERLTVEAQTELKKLCIERTIRRLRA